MMPGVKIEGAEKLQRNLGVNIPKQIKFATMQTINDVALEVQNFEIKTQLPGKLTLRSKGSPWWKPGTRYGINIRPFATKNKLQAVVGSFADWLKLQEEGGVKRASGHRLAIEAGARPGEREVIPSRLRPRALMRQAGQQYTQRGKTRTASRSGKGFIINTRSGPAIFVRNGSELKLMYMLEATARIPAILGFFESGSAVVSRTYQEKFNKRFNAAIATARQE